MAIVLLGGMHGFSATTYLHERTPQYQVADYSAWSSALSY